VRVDVDVDAEVRTMLVVMRLRALRHMVLGLVL